MKFLSYSCEAHLYEKVRSLKEIPHNSWRCLYFHHKGAAADALRSRWLTVVLPVLHKNAEGYVYLCGDGDVFILFQGSAKAVLTRLEEEFIPFIDKPYMLFDLGVHWQMFYHLCKSKFIHAQLMQDEMPGLSLPSARTPGIAPGMADEQWGTA